MDYLAELKASLVISIKNDGSPKKPKKTMGSSSFGLLGSSSKESGGRRQCDSFGEKITKEPKKLKNPNCLGSLGGLHEDNKNLEKQNIAIDDQIPDWMKPRFINDLEDKLINDILHDLPILPEDRIFIKRKLRTIHRENRSRILDRYKEIWVDAIPNKTKEHLRDSIGRHAANTWLMSGGAHER